MPLQLHPKNDYFSCPILVITLYAQGDEGNSSLIVFCFYVDQPNDTCRMISSYDYVSRHFVRFIHLA